MPSLAGPDRTRPRRARDRLCQRPVGGKVNRQYLCPGAFRGQRQKRLAVARRQHQPCPRAASARASASPMPALAPMIQIQRNSRRGSSRNIRAHCDVGNEFYRQWLDPGMTYSSALFADEDGTDSDLERAQARKNTRLLSSLAEGGRAVVQAITVPDAGFFVYRRRSDFIRQHVFAGGMLPCNAAMMREAAQAGLSVRSNLAFGQHYARTCRIWLSRMMGERKRILRMGYDGPFLRSRQFYLEGCAATFATGRLDVV